MLNEENAKSLIGKKVINVVFIDNCLTIVFDNGAVLSQMINEFDDTTWFNLVEGLEDENKVEG